MAARDDAGEKRASTTRGRQRGDEVPVTQRQSPSGVRRYGFESPFGLMQQLSDEMSRLFHDAGLSSGSPTRAFGHPFSVPQVDVFRRGDDVVVQADLPGLSRDDITVEFHDNVLTIRGERREEEREQREGYYWHERSEGSFLRIVPLPEGADPDRATARFENGVLEVSFPAPQREEPRGRRIEIR